MPTIPFATEPVTVATLVAVISGTVAILKAADWAWSRLGREAERAVDPLALRIAKIELEMERHDDALNAFKVEVAKQYVPNEVIPRLERRIDEVSSAVREEMREVRDTLLRAILESKRA